MEVTTDDVHGSEVFPRLLEEAESHGRVIKAYGDGAYNTGGIYEFSESRGVDAVIKPRKNSRIDTSSEARRGHRVSGYSFSLGGVHARWI